MITIVGLAVVAITIPSLRRLVKVVFEDEAPSFNSTPSVGKTEKTTSKTSNTAEIYKSTDEETLVSQNFTVSAKPNGLPGLRTQLETVNYSTVHRNVAIMGALSTNRVCVADTDLESVTSYSIGHMRPDVLGSVTNLSGTSEVAAARPSQEYGFSSRGQGRGRGYGRRYVCKFGRGSGRRPVTCVKCGGRGHYADSCQLPFGAIRRSWSSKLKSIACRLREEANQPVVWAD